MRGCNVRGVHTQGLLAGTVMEWARYLDAGHEVSGTVPVLY